MSPSMLPRLSMIWKIPRFEISSAKLTSDFLKHAFFKAIRTAEEEKTEDTEQPAEAAAEDMPEAEGDTAQSGDDAAPEDSTDDPEQQ